jgi:hypothetical protein
MADNFDLFGDPIPDNWGKRGRPQHIPTTENINKVMMMVALGWNNDRMANAMDITRPTFRKHYFSMVKRQRDTARDRLDSSYAMHLWKQVQEGNVGAMRLWAAFMDRNDAAVGHNSFYSDQRREADAARAAEKPEPVGKKAQAAAAALTAGDGTQWGDDLKPN